MKKLQKLLLPVMLILYAAGVFTGALREIYEPKQAEMYSFLEQGMIEYTASAKDGIKSAFAGNMKVFALLAAGGLFRPLIWAMCLAITAMGYLTGFSVMAALRLYGIRGLLICLPNLISVTFLIPASLYYSSIIAAGLIKNEDKRFLGKRFIVLTLLLFAIFCADSVIKGAFSASLIKWAAKRLSGI